ncbi:hypothetical protein SAMN05661096_02807 [Marivirga sericea]|uniref:Uncharacterized protein n=2 Tax=Marivirga sericea TaxID=1028 RepID=A0A1X7KHC6_9BACT|nr:hypothetical protein SAMN05661096_02807 [Marivirga sericea]
MFNMGIAVLHDRKMNQEAVNNPYQTGQIASKSDYIDVRLAGGIGLRYQEPKTPFVFRIRVSYPESIYIG